MPCVSCMKGRTGAWLAYYMMNCAALFHRKVSTRASNAVTDSSRPPRVSAAAVERTDKGLGSRRGPVFEVLAPLLGSLYQKKNGVSRGRYAMTIGRGRSLIQARVSGVVCGLGDTGRGYE